MQIWKRYYWVYFILLKKKTNPLKIVLQFQLCLNELSQMCVALCVLMTM